ncbi:hypothetical protein LTR84_007987 [Exophiala bonariae]|uniref:Beta-glucuronidase C-terminal domain-containing protein n=1 Tax=Exophiala bonariae TaxID=1690606 RepID=A0AAV9NQ65_9EURO|nr:hypothetical protein LTR84_007987 [Exophiala bonariae]
MRAFYLLAGLAISQVQSISHSYEIKLQLPSRMPAWAEQLSPGLAAFSLELDRWTDWAGKEIGQPNEYFNQLLLNLGERTGQMPFIRVGANSADRATIDLDVKVVNATFPPANPIFPNPEADHIFIGRDFYALSGNLPTGTPFVWGLNMKLLNLTETTAQARLLAESFHGARANITSHVKLANIEIGNEPDFWGPTRTPVRGTLGPSWDVVNYTNTWLKFANTVSNVLDLNCSDPSSPRLMPGSFTTREAPEWIPEGMLQAGLLNNPNLSCEISHVSGHSYSGAFDPRIIVRPGQLMDKISIRTNMSTRTIGRIAVRASGLKYLLGETNSYALHGQPGLSNTVESALWTTDWLLLAASYGIERVHLHQGVGFRYNAIQPTSNADDGLNITQPHILPSYYALLVVNEAIGTSGTAFIAEIPTTNLTLTAYGIWEEQRLARLVVLNTQIYLGTGNKPSINVTLDGLYAGGALTMKLLQTEKTTAYTGLTWAGQNFETASGRPEGKVVEEQVEEGSFNLPASSIALLTLED